MASARWIIGQGDWLKLSGEETLSGVFNVLHLTYTHVETGERRTVSAADQASRERIGTLAKVIRARRPLTESEAQDIANRAIWTLGGEQESRWFVTLADDHLLTHVGGQARPAREIEDFDTVQLDADPKGRRLYALVLGRDREAGRIELKLSDRSEGREEMEFEMINLERDE